MRALVLLAIVAVTLAVQLPLTLSGSVCAALISSFDPILIDIHFPTLPAQQQGETFKAVVTQLITEEIIYQRAVAPNSTLRESLKLEQNQLHEICITFDSERNFEEGDEQVVFIGFTQTQDFQSLIGQIQIPPELAKQENLKQLYTSASKLTGLAKVVSQHQNKQRQLQDQIVARDLHKSQRVLTLSLIQCLVIILSGVYQVCALRKFLIEKNLY